MREPRATVDFETRSACDLLRRGAWLYSKDPSTEILCLSYHLPGMNPRKPTLWHCAHPAIGIEESPWPTLQPLFEWIEQGGKVEAHNATFEMSMWENNAFPLLRWPPVRREQWMCSAAKAAAHALPRSLDGAINALGLPIKKDAAGKALINRYSKPRKLTKAEAELWPDEIIFNEDREGLERYWKYNGQDVTAEHYFSESIPDLSPMERQVWLITQEMNTRGVLIDTDLARAALYLAKKAKDKANAELEALTGIDAGTKRAAVKAWLADCELLELPDTKAKTVEWFLEREDMSDRARRVLQIIKEVNRTSTNKYKRMLECVDEDDRARELLLYCGAERTGRFAGRGIQVHNLPKGKFTFPLNKADKPRAMDIACDDVKSRDLAWCEMIHGDVMNLLASCLRGSIIAPPGRDLLTADYAAIEARCVLWESGADAALNVFREGGDIYCDMASGIYGYTIVKDDKARLKNSAAKIAEVINSTGATQRDFGKVAVLGLGYGMGFLKFLITLRTYNIYLSRDEVLRMMGAKRLAKYEKVVRKKLFPQKDDYDEEKKFKAAEREASINRRRLTDEREDPMKVLHELALCKYTVDTYRSRYPEVPAMWKAQEAAAIKAVQTNRPVKCGPVTWFVKGRFLKCRLPSGRCLNYCDPEIKMAKTSWGELKPSLRFWGIDQKTKRWIRQASYGGKLVENITQAIARDIMCHATIALDDDIELDLLLSVHDELVAETDHKEAGSPEAKAQEAEFEKLMSDCLTAAYAGCPITAEAKRYGRYRK